MLNNFFVMFFFLIECIFIYSLEVAPVGGQHELAARQVEGKLPPGHGQQVGQAGQLRLHQGVGSPVHGHGPGDNGGACGACAAK